MTAAYSTTRPVLLVVDDKSLRRAQLGAFLAAWAEASELEILEYEAGDATALVDIKVSLIVFRVGHAVREVKRLRRVTRLMKALHPEVPLVLLADGEGGASVREALAAGCQGYLPSSFAPEIALAALSFILAGGTYFPTEALGESEPPPRIEQVPPAVSHTNDLHKIRAVRKITDDNEPTGVLGGMVASVIEEAAPTLTSRQIEVLEGLRDGQSNKEIARKLALAEATVKVHVRQIIRKFGVQNRTQAAVCAAISPDRSRRIRRAS